MSTEFGWLIISAVVLSAACPARGQAPPGVQPPTLSPPESGLTRLPALSTSSSPNHVSPEPVTGYYPDTAATGIEAADTQNIPTFRVPVRIKQPQPADTSVTTQPNATPTDPLLPQVYVDPFGKSDLLMPPDGFGPSAIDPADLTLSSVAPPSLTSDLFGTQQYAERIAQTPKASPPVENIPTPQPSTPPASQAPPAAGPPIASEPGSMYTPADAAPPVMEGVYGGQFYGDEFGDGCGPQGTPFDESAFCPGPNYSGLKYNPLLELGIYDWKWQQCSQRPLIELGRGVYRDGPVPESYSFLGRTNLGTPGFNLFGDFRTAIAANDNGVGDTKAIWASRLNLDFDLRLTATERIHAFIGPIDEDGRFTRAELFTDGADDLRFFEEFDDDFDTLFFEGDMGYIWGGITDQWAPFDLPFVAGKFPLLFQNGVWINDALEGFAFTIPARNSPLLDWSNFDVTFFFGLDDIDSPAFAGNDNAANVYGVNAFIEAYGGYTEFGYAFLDDTTGQGLSYNNLGIAYTRRYFERISNSVRVLLNMGQDPVNGPQTADGQLILIENALVSSNPTYYVPYLNFFAGFDRPQAVALAAGGVLLNTGINFETDALTGFPRLTDTAQDAWGGAFGFNLLGPRFSWQWILEAAMVQTFGDSPNGDEYAVGSRFQIPINFAWLVRFNAMYGLREKADDISGFTAELRWKF